MDYEIIIAWIAVSIAVAATCISSWQTRESNRIAKISVDSYQKTTEADLLLRLNDSIYRSVEGKEIIECAKNKTPVLDTKGGKVTERDLENFLNELETVLILVKEKTLSPTTAKQGFRWVIERIIEHDEIMNYIKERQKEYGEVAWKPITDYESDSVDYSKKQADHK